MNTLFEKIYGLNFILRSRNAKVVTVAKGLVKEEIALCTCLIRHDFLIEGVNAAYSKL